EPPSSHSDHHTLPYPYWSRGKPAILAVLATSLLLMVRPSTKQHCLQFSSSTKINITIKSRLRGWTNQLRNRRPVSGWAMGDQSGSCLLGAVTRSCVQEPDRPL